MSSGIDERQRVFESAVRAVFSRWTLLRLAIDEGWSDGDPTMLANSLLQDLLSLLISDKKIYRDQVEDLLFDTLESKFNTLAEDGSVEEVSALLLAIRAECAVGNFATANGVIQKAMEASPAARASVAQGADSDADDDDEDQDATTGGAALPTRRTQQHEPPEFDDDGFQVVKSKGRRR